MTTPTELEQLMIELTNRFRADPGADFDNMVDVQTNIENAIDFFGVDLNVLAAALNDLDSAAPLAWSNSLSDAADSHSQAMIDADEQSHQTPGEDGLVERVETAGYDNFSALGENVFAYTEDMLYGHAGFVIDWGEGPNGMQDPAGHRLNLISSDFTEVGMSVIAENDPATDVGPFVVTQDFGNRFNYEAQLVGVVIDDLDGDNFYDLGEGMGGVTVEASGTEGTFSTATWDSGGWQMEVPAGTYTITFSGGGLSGSISKTATIGADNVKVDAEADEAVAASTTPTTGDDILTGTANNDDVRGLKGDDEISGLGGDDTLSGGDGDDEMFGGDGDDAVSGNRGDDTLNGDAGDDDLRGSSGDDTLNGGAGDDKLRGGTGLDALNGGDGADTLLGGARRDTLNGDGGADELDGGKANDILNGGAGADTLIGHKGHDTLTGGAGADTFKFRSGHGDDVITDFEDGVDDIMFINTGLTFADLTITANGGDALVDYGAGSIELAGIASTLLSADDFTF